MSAFNIVKFRVKPGCEQQLIDAHRGVREGLKGFKRGVLVDTGERTFCFIGEWESFANIAASRDQMITILDRFRETLEDLGDGKGVTDPVSGEAVLEA
jgi:hypothetical protein